MTTIHVGTGDNYSSMQTRYPCQHDEPSWSFTLDKKGTWLLHTVEQTSFGPVYQVWVRYLVPKGNQLTTLVPYSASPFPFDLLVPERGPPDTSGQIIVRGNLVRFWPPLAACPTPVLPDAPQVLIQQRLFSRQPCRGFWQLEKHCVMIRTIHPHTHRHRQTAISAKQLFWSTGDWINRETRFD